MAIVIDSLPLFWEQGFSRHDVLNMKHWEVDLFIKSYYKHQARRILALTDALYLSNGFIEEDTHRKIVDRLMIQAGFKKKEVNHNWLAELKMFASGKG